MTSAIRRVLIVGGTHGNELTGIYLIKKFDRAFHLITRSSFETTTLLANPRAIELNRRYVDTDLNRSFAPETLTKPAVNYEDQRAIELAQTYGVHSPQPIDYVIDLHSTTSNMGRTLILRLTDTINQQLAAYVVAQHPDVKIFNSRLDAASDPHLDSIGKFGCTLEVGPIAQGILSATLFAQTEAVVGTILDFLDIYNHSKLIQKLPPEITYYQTLSAIDYPRDQNGQISAMIHPNLQFADYQALHPGEAMFLTFQGDVIPYTGLGKVYPVFINEAAYYEKQIAMTFMQLRTLSIDVVRETQ